MDHPSRLGPRVVLFVRRLEGGEPVVESAATVPDDYIPWGAADDGRTIWSPPALDSPPPGSRYLRNWDEREPRRLRKRRFESRLAQLVLLNPALVSDVVGAVNASIVALLEARREHDLETIATVLRSYLYTPPGQMYLGVVGLAAAAPRDDGEVFETCVERLRLGSADICYSLNFHRAFMARLYPALVTGQKRETMRALRREIAIPTDFSTRDRPVRRPVTGPRTVRRDIGIIRGDRPQLHGAIQRHIPAMQKYEPADPGHPYFANAAAVNMPFVAGHSLSAAVLLRCAFAMTPMRKGGEAAKQYTLACVAFLVGGGNHAFHEVMVAAKEAEIPYRDGHYATAFPAKLLAFPAYKALMEEFGRVVVPRTFGESGAAGDDG